MRRDGGDVFVVTRIFSDQLPVPQRRFKRTLTESVIKIYSCKWKSKKSAWASLAQASVSLPLYARASPSRARLLH